MRIFSSLAAGAIAAAALAAASPAGAQVADPPFSGTVFIDPDVITASDPTTFTRAHYCCIRERKMFDRRVNDTITVDAHIVDVSFSDSDPIQVIVNPEFYSSASAGQSSGALSSRDSVEGVQVLSVGVGQRVKVLLGRLDLVVTHPVHY
jgi:hypothetical protein